jgi:peroxiredoxin
MHAGSPTKIRSYVAASTLALAIGVGAYLSYPGTMWQQLVPNVAYTRLDGTPGSTDQLRGKVVLVNFWATSCATCVHEMPRIAATYQKFRQRGFETLAVAMSYDPPAYVVNFAETRQLPFTVVIDNTGQFARSFGDVKLTPTTLLIDKKGRIVKRYLGEPDFAALHQLIETLLAET